MVSKMKRQAFLTAHFTHSLWSLVSDIEIHIFIFLLPAYHRPRAASSSSKAFNSYEPSLVLTLNAFLAAAIVYLPHGYWNSYENELRTQHGWVWVWVSCEICIISLQSFWNLFESNVSFFSQFFNFEFRSHCVRCARDKKSERFKCDALNVSMLDQYIHWIKFEGKGYLYPRTNSLFVCTNYK